MRYPILDKVELPRDLKKLGRKELIGLCTDIRRFMIESVSKTGGHLASSLGAVELTVAMHKFFNTPKDKIIWDVGHQSYAHKIITGRKDRFGSIRQYGGISGFPKSSESKFDHFDVGHASTALSVGLGFAKARDLSRQKHNVICFLGDGALTGGEAFEGLNQIGYLNSRIIIILNDNKMSISNNVGALSKFTSRITKTRIYRRIREDIYGLIKKGLEIEDVLNLKDSMKRAAAPNFLFEKLGIDYIGPVDGHNLNEIFEALSSAKQIKGPVLIHAKTRKGKGFEFAEKNATKFHGIGCFNSTNGKPTKKKEGVSNSDTFGNTLCKLAKDNKKIVAITAAMCEGTGLARFRELFPKRFFDVGIAEQHAVTFAAGLAKMGFLPVVAIYSTFLQRAYDQIVHDVALQNLPVVFAVDRAGLVGEDGPTHHGVFDISYLRGIPNMGIAAPKDARELAQLLYSSFDYNMPFAIRFPRGVDTVATDGYHRHIRLGSWETVRKGSRALVVGLGSMVGACIEAADRVGDIEVINARFIKPLSSGLIRHIESFKKIIVVEEGCKAGGFGSLILENTANKGNDIHCMGLSDKFITHGKRELLLKHNHLDADSIEKEIKSMI